MSSTQDAPKPISTEYFFGFLHRKRLFRFVYAALTFCALFAVVVAFFQVSTRQGVGTHHFKKLSTTQWDDGARVLQYIEVFYVVPFVFAWVIVYFGHLVPCWNLKRLQKARNFRYNLLVTSVVLAAFYMLFIYFVMSMNFAQGARFRSALIVGICEFALLSVELLEQHEVRRARHRRKKLLRKELKMEAALRRQAVASSSEETSRAMSTSLVIRNNVPGGFV